MNNALKIGLSIISMFRVLFQIETSSENHLPRSSAYPSKFAALLIPFVCFLLKLEQDYVV